MPVVFVVRGIQPLLAGLWRDDLLPICPVPVAPDLAGDPDFGDGARCCPEDSPGLLWTTMDYGITNPQSLPCKRSVNRAALVGFDMFHRSHSLTSLAGARGWHMMPADDTPSPWSPQVCLPPPAAVRRRGPAHPRGTRGSAIGLRHGADFRMGGRMALDATKLVGT